MAQAWLHFLHTNILKFHTMKKDQQATTATSKKTATKKTTGTKQRIPLAIDNTRVTEKVRSKPGHGLANEGTNVDYQEQR
jgi:hypothetical protein